jgi:PAS domain S-box-containing protein
MPQAPYITVSQSWFSATHGLGQRIARVASALTILVGCLVLMGWSLDISIVKSLIPGAATMKANTAFCFVLAGISLGLQTRNRQSSRTPGIVQGCAIALMTIALLTLGQYLFGWNFGIDQLLFQDPSFPQTRYPGRMGDNTALTFALTGLALYLREQRTRRIDVVVQTAIGCAAAIVLLAVVGYVYNVQIFYQFFFYSTSMAFHTALTFLVLCGGILASRTDYSLWRIFTENRVGSSVARRLLPMAIAVPFCLGWLILLGQRANLYDTGFCIALLVISLILTMAIVILVNAQRINHIDYDRSRSSDRLRSSEERLELAQVAANFVTWEWEPQTNSLVWSEQGYSLFGISPDDPTPTDTWTSRIYPDDTDLVQAAIQQCLTTGIVEIEYRIQHPEQGIRWVLSRAGLASDNPNLMRGISFDITDRKQAEMTLRENEACLDLAMRSAQMGFWELNLQNHKAYWSSRALELLGLPPDFTDYSYETIIALVHPNDRSLVSQAIALAIKTGGDYQLEFRVIWADGSVHWLSDQGQVFYDQAGQAVQIMMGVAFDITDRKQAQLNEQFLNDLDRQLRQFSTVSEMTAETTRQLGEYLEVDRCQFWEVNAAIDSFTIFQDWGGTSSRVGTYRFSDFVLPDLQAAYQAGQVVAVADVTCDPLTVDYADNFVPYGVRAFAGAPCQFAGQWVGGLSIDQATPRQWKADELSLLKEVVARLWSLMEQTRAVEALRQTAEDLAETNRLKDEFLAALSHELRTPLHPILGWTAMMKTQRLTPEKTAEALAIIDRNVQQQIRLVDDLLDVSSVIQGKLKLEFRPLNLAQIIQNAISTVQFSAQAKDITLELQGLTALNLIADGDRLQQVFWNLLANAIKFTSQGGRVAVETTMINGDTHPYAQVRVTDTGVGIEPEFLPYVFDRFRQADGSITRQFGGLGLGLSIVRHLVELHGGSVSVDSPGIGQGAIFTVRLPIPIERLENRAVPNPNSSTPSLNPDFAPAATAILTGARILIVDDDQDNVDLLRFLLQQDGAEVTAVSSPSEARELIAQQPPDLIISDIGMAERDGYKLMQQVRALPQGQAIPAVALTGFSYWDNQQKAIEAGFQTCISKPVDLTELLAVLAQLLHR